MNGMIVLTSMKRLTGVSFPFSGNVHRRVLVRQHHRAVAPQDVQHHGHLDEGDPRQGLPLLPHPDRRRRHHQRECDEERVRHYQVRQGQPQEHRPEQDDHCKRRVTQTRRHDDRSDDNQQEQGTEATRNPGLEERETGHHDGHRADDQGTRGSAVRQRPALEPPFDQRGDALDHIRLAHDFGSALGVVSSGHSGDASGATADSGNLASVTCPFTVAVGSSPTSAVVACRAAGAVGPIDRVPRAPTALVLMSIDLESAVLLCDAAHVADGAGPGRSGPSGPGTVPRRSLLPDSARRHPARCRLGRSTKATPSRDTPTRSIWSRAATTESADEPAPATSRVRSATAQTMYDSADSDTAGDRITTRSALPRNEATSLPRCSIPSLRTS